MVNKKIPKPISGAEIILTPESFTPSREDMKVVGVFNPGSTKIIDGGLEKTLMMVRVAETPIDNPEEEGFVYAPHFNVDNRNDSLFSIDFDKYSIDELSRIGKKEISFKNGDSDRLRHISSPRVCILNNSGDIEKKEICSLYPCYEHERFGIEDVRITRMNIGNEIRFGNEDYEYVITYVSPHRSIRLGTSIALTNDFKNFARVTPNPDDTPRPVTSEKDVVFFPEKMMIKDFYGASVVDFCALTRPSSYYTISPPDISVAFASNLVRWGPNRRLFESKNGGVSGPGPHPLKLEDTWLVFYHQVILNGDKDKQYKTAIMGLDINRPWEVKYPSRVLIEPDNHNRQNLSYVPNVTYVMGAELFEDGNKIEIISGEGDECVSRRVYDREDIVRFLKDKSPL